jgi:hypothetical protein
LGAPCLDSETWVSRRKSTLRLAFTTIAGTVLGLGLAAFYLLPAAYERRYVEITLATVEGMRIDQNFLFEHTGITTDEIEHDVVLHTASILAVVMLIATGVALAVWFVRRKRAAPSKASGELAVALPLPVALLAVVIGFLQTPWSKAIWSHTPEAAFLQFPWRLLAVLAAVLGFAVAACLDRLRIGSKTTILVGFGLVVALTLPAYRIFRQGCDTEDAVPARLALFHSNAGTDPTDEYTPQTADNDVLKTGNPAYWLANSAKAPAPALAMPGVAPRHFTVDAAQDEDLIVNLRDYPSWRILMNGAVDPQRLHRADGLIALSIPAGHLTVDIREVRLRDRTAGDAVTLLAIALLAVAARRSRARL